MSTLIMTVGLPQSGKTTWAKEQGYPIVNPDSIRLALHGKTFIPSMEPWVWAFAKSMVKSLFLAGHETVILDATNTTQKRRDEWKSPDWTRKFQECGGPATKGVCLIRAKETCVDAEHMEGLSGAIKRMAEQWEPISDEERDD